MRISILVLIVFFSGKLSAQLLLEDISKTFKKAEDVQSYALVNPDNFETTTYFKTKNDLSIYQFSSGFLLKDSLVIEGLPRTLTTILGGTIANESSNRLYFTDENLKSIYTYSFDLKAKKADSLARFEMPLNEYITQIFEHKNAMYVFTISKDESWVRVYAFKNKTQPIVQTYSLDGFQIVGQDGANLSFKEVIRKSNSFEFPYSIEYIKPDFQSQLMQVAARRKMYVENEKIYLSFDYNPEKTSWVVLDLEAHSIRFQQTDLPKISLEDKAGFQFNSFLHERMVYSLKKNMDTLKVNVVDFETNEIVKTFDGTKEKIDFSNTELFYNPGRNKEFKQYKSAKPFFKKTKNSYWGIGVFTEKDGYAVTIGAIKENPNNAFLVGDIFLNTLVIAAGSDVGYEPILMNLSETEFQSSFFETKLTFELRHQLGTLEPNAEHKINFFLSENPKVKNPFVFKRLSYYVLSYYDAKKDKIYFRKFD